MTHARDRAIIYANRAACLMKMVRRILPSNEELGIWFWQEKYEAAVQSSTKSIELDSNYLKAYVRRAESYKKIDKLEDALQDYQKILQLDPNHQQARQEVYVSSRSSFDRHSPPSLLDFTGSD